MLIKFLKKVARGTLKAVILKVWSLEHQYQYHLGTY